MSKSTQPQFVQKSVDRISPVVQVYTAAFHLGNPEASMILVTPPSIKPTAESKPEIQQVKQRSPKSPPLPL